MAVGRMRSSDNIGELAKELGVTRRQVTGATVTTDRVKLHTSQIAGTLASINAPNFAVNNLPTLFTSNGINQVQVVVSSGMEFEGVSGGSSLATGNNVVLRGLLFKTAGDPILVAKKVRKL